MSNVRVLETNVLHASDILYWLDGSTAEDTSDMQRVPHELDLELTSMPRDLHIRHARGKTALWRNPVQEMIEGIATNAEKAFSSTGTFPLAGVVTDPRRAYNPRAFSLTAGATEVPVSGQALVMYPSPAATRFNSCGGLITSLRFADDERVAPWALLTVVVTVPGGTQTYRAQTDHRGDVLLPLNRLPPLPEGTTEFSARLSVQALEEADPALPVDTADLVPMTLESLNSSGTFSDPIGFTVVPGGIQLLRSASKDHLAVQP